MGKIVITYTTLLLVLFGLHAHAETPIAPPPFAMEVECPPISFKQYKQLKEGMTYDEVVSIVGLEGTEVSRAGNYTTYAWGSKTFYCLTASFMNGKLQTVAQTGLK